jgi:hypothetical protein
MVTNVSPAWAERPWPSRTVCSPISKLHYAPPVTPQ